MLYNPVQPHIEYCNDPADKFVRSLYLLFSLFRHAHKPVQAMQWPKYFSGRTANNFPRDHPVGKFLYVDLFLSG